MDELELIRAVIDAGQRGDVDVLAALVHPEFVGIVPPSMSAEPDTYSGPDGVRRYFELFRDIVDDVEMSVYEIEDAGDWSIVTSAVMGTGRASGIPVNLGVAIGTQVRDGRLYWMEAFPNVDAARRELAARSA